MFRINQIRPVCTDKPVSQLLLNLLKASDEIHPLRQCMKNNPVRPSSCLKKTDFRNWNMANRI